MAAAEKGTLAGSSAAALTLAACVGINTVSRLARPQAAPDPLPFKVAEQEAVESASFFSLGMRRLTADLGLIRLLIYYGTPEALSDHSNEHAHGHQHHDKFDEIGPRAMRILDADPAFSYPTLLASGILAFNLNRQDEALELLRYGLTRDQGNWQYRKYVAAIGFHRHGDSKSVISILEPHLSDSNCPTMIKGMLAFLYLRTGRRQDAVRLYREIMDSSRDEEYGHLARQKLAELNELD